MQHEIRHNALIAIDADPEVGKSEFVLYAMKFSNSRLFTNIVSSLNAFIGQTDIFNC
jgi:hypothetical protein